MYAHCGWSSYSGNAGYGWNNVSNISDVFLFTQEIII